MRLLPGLRNPHRNAMQRCSYATGKFRLRAIIYPRSRLMLSSLQIRSRCGHTGRMLMHHNGPTSSIFTSQWPANGIALRHSSHRTYHDATLCSYDWIVTPWETRSPNSSSTSLYRLCFSTHYQTVANKTKHPRTGLRLRRTVFRLRHNRSLLKARHTCPERLMQVRNLQGYYI